MGRLEERFVERRYLVVGRRLELSPTNRPRPTPVGGAVELGEAVEDAHYEVGKTKSGPAVREPVSEVDIRVPAGGFSGVLRGDEDHRPAVACVAQHAYDALHHALRYPARKRRLQRRPPLAREFVRAIAGDLVSLHELLQEPGELAWQPFRLEWVHPRPREPSPLELADELVALVRLYPRRRVDVDDRRRGERRPGPPAAMDVPQPPGTRVDQTPYPQASLPVPPYPDQRPLRVGGYREPPEFPRIEGKRAWKLEPLQALGRPPLGVEERGLGEDGAEDDRALLLAQHARLVADSEEAFQGRDLGQRVNAARGLGYVSPSVSHEPSQIPRV